ncbi:hypothetical protein Nmel_005281 [Mimus melanotis]
MGVLGTHQVMLLCGFHQHPALQEAPWNSREKAKKRIRYLLEGQSKSRIYKYF